MLPAPLRIPVLLALLAVPAWAEPPSGGRPPDLVVLVDGTRLEGRVVLEEAARVVLRVGTRDRVLERSEIQSVESRLAAWREAMERWRHLEKEDATKIADIATFATRLGLPEEARVFALRSIAADPENRVARDILGHERKEKDWTLREDGRRWNWTERVKKSADFRDAWELETTHWVVRSNLPLLEATNAILDLENVYAIWFDVIAPQVGAYHLDTPLQAQIHADASSYPELGGSRGFYDRAGNILIVNATGGLDRSLLVHEAIHQLLSSTAVLARGGKGAIAPWLDEGLAEYFRATTGGPPGRLAYDANAIDSRSMRAQVHAVETYKLSRILTFDSGEYLSTSRQDLKYAQSYNFVHFLMAADGGHFRERFFLFLRSAWNGQGSSTDLEAAIGAKVDAIEKAWVAWVRDRAR
ncbi:MAG: DUF1570 domain-containing protein [Planctomycetota bacterium]|nr:DUF1570 domain-containing protein [Planctomycetota bacterium]